MKYNIGKKEIFEYRPLPFFFLTTSNMSEYTDQKVRQSLLDLIDCGYGGLILFNKPPRGFDKKSYLSNDWFSVVRKFCVYCKELGLKLWINDGHDYPPGSVAGRVYDIDPTLNQKHLAIKDGKVEVVCADWGFPAFESERANEIYHDLVHEEYKKNVSEFFGNPIVGFFTDGDNRRVQPPVMFSETHKCRNYFPWSDNFEKDFFDKYGYDIKPYLLDIMQRKAIPQAVDYWGLAGLEYQKWFRSNKKWLEENGLLYTGHTSDSAPYSYSISPRTSALTEGRFSDMESIFDYPGTDQELLALDGGKHLSASTWHTPKVIYGEPMQVEKMTGYYDISTDTRAKQTSSTAFIYGKEKVMCEMFAASNYAVSPTELRQIFAFQAMQGVTMVVPHAYHYKYFGQTKYFAPPEFSKRGIIGEYVREFNDNIAEICAMLSKGKPVYPIALLDPTEAVWKNNIRFDEYCNTFATLNRLPYGFIITDYEKLYWDTAKDIKIVVVSGFDLELDKIEKLRRKGLIVLQANQVDDICKYLSLPFEYQADGHLMFNRRLIDGEEFVFLSNIENDRPINVKFNGFGKNQEFKLYQGEIKYISKTYQNIETDDKEYIQVDFIDGQIEVEYDKPNYIQLETFVSNGKTCVKTGEEKTIDFCFTAKDSLFNLKLYIPENAFDAVSEVLIDGQQVSSKKGLVFDEEYRVYDIQFLDIGEHKITLKKDKKLQFFDRIFITGEFDVKVLTDNKSFETVIDFYNLSVSIANQTKIILSKRTNSLVVSKSWAKQGQPFYSGKTIYKFNYNFEEAGNYQLDLRKVRDIAQVFVDGKSVGRKIYPPYTFDFYSDKGSKEIKIEVTNSLGNEMECYLEESGILDGIVIKKEKN
ncbi:MAG: hypothetical protein E7348_05525 [Clostridiales bacterium]|nr:hypothetical protein [Clostridiales bacterium]